jgi:hypothetical protein
MSEIAVSLSWRIRFKGPKVDVESRNKDSMSNLSTALVIPDFLLAKEATDILREHSTDLLFDHSIRGYPFAAEQGRPQRLRFDPEVLYVAEFHNLGLLEKFSSPNERFEVDGANAARQFPATHDVSQEQLETDWEAIALRTTRCHSVHAPRSSSSLFRRAPLSMCSEQASISSLRSCAIRSSRPTRGNISGNVSSRHTSAALHTSQKPPSAP